MSENKEIEKLTGYHREAGTGRHVRRFWKRPGGIGIRGRGAGNRDRRDAAGG